MANTLLQQEATQSPSLNTGWQKKAVYVVGVVFSVLWLVLGGLVALSRGKSPMVDAMPPAIVERYNIDDAPKYVFTTKPHIEQ